MRGIIRTLAVAAIAGLALVGPFSAGAQAQVVCPAVADSTSSVTARIILHGDSEANTCTSVGPADNGFVLDVAVQDATRSPDNLIVYLSGRQGASPFYPTSLSCGGVNGSQATANRLLARDFVLSQTDVSCTFQINFPNGETASAAFEISATPGGLAPPGFQGTPRSVSIASFTVNGTAFDTTPPAPLILASRPLSA